MICNPFLTIETRKRVLKCYVEPVLTYGCESWTIGQQTRKSLESVEMWFYRRMLRIPWTAKKSNENVMREVKAKRELISNIRKKQSSFFGHVMRREQLEYIVTTGKIEGRRDRGKQREKITDSLREWLGRRSTTEMINSCRDRKLWRDMVTYASKAGT